jgi:hypothetical protein
MKASGSTYLGIQYNLDDHMVYAAWMRQAMEGSFLFDNRFAVDAQPGLTFHLYFLVLGWIAALIGIPLTMALARVTLSALFVFLVYRLVRRVTPDVFTTKLAMSLVVFGAGIGFFVWQTFGVDFSKPSPLSGVLLNHLPTDIWQPEGYVFSSMLTSGLFMVSLCLILVVLICFLNAQFSWRPVLPGAVAFALLMNIHSYDVLLVALVMVGFLVMALRAGLASKEWVIRSLVIGSGAIPPALWFMHVLRSDPVFQARAATETYSPNFRQVLFGYLLLIVLALIGVWAKSKIKDQPASGHQSSISHHPSIGLATIGLIIVGLFIGAGSHTGGYFLQMGGWIVVFVASLAALALVATKDIAFNLVASWAVIGTIAPYFPALFQRKLAMGLSVPWAILAALGIAYLARNQERSARNLVLVLAILVTGASSMRWLFREVQLARNNVSNTTLHPVYLSNDATQIIKLLNQEEGRKVVVAMPGVNAPMVDEQGNPVPDQFGTPAVPDLNPILSGLTGVYTYAGHWSETPNYNERRTNATKLFLNRVPEGQTTREITEAERKEILGKISPDFIVTPAAELYEGQIADLRPLGQTVYDGQQLRLIRINR